MAQATWWKTIKNLRVYLNITKVKVVHHVSHQNFFKKSNIGIVLPLKERMAPSLFSWNWVENIILRRKGTYLFVQCLSLFESSSPETQKTCKKSDRSGFEWVGWLLTFYNPEKPFTFFCTHLFCCSSLILFHCNFIRKYSSTLARLFVSRTWGVRLDLWPSIFINCFLDTWCTKLSILQPFLSVFYISICSTSAGWCHW